VHKPKIVVLGRMCEEPVAGVVWQVVHYLVGLERLGFDVYYVEWRGNWLPNPIDPAVDAEWPRVMVGSVLREYGFGGRWICRADCVGAGCTFGDLSAADLPRLYREAEAVINLTASHTLEDDQLCCRRRVYLETDPGLPQVRLSEGDERMWELVSAHTHHLTFAENLFGADCLLPRTDLRYIPTRQPVVLDFWHPAAVPPGERFTTIAKWKKSRSQRVIRLNGDTYHWSKDLEFARFLELPRRTRQPIELALATIPAEDVLKLQQHGWQVADAAVISRSLDEYRRYVHQSRGEFTVAKDLNIRTCSGWFSDRSACYLAAGRPVINQDTGFDRVLPTGEGLFSFRSMDDILAAFDAVNSDYERHSRAALDIAHEYFDARKVLGRLLESIGVDCPHREGRPEGLHYGTEDGPRYGTADGRPEVVRSGAAGVGSAGLEACVAAGSGSAGLEARVAAGDAARATRDDVAPELASALADLVNGGDQAAGFSIDQLKGSRVHRVHVGTGAASRSFIVKRFSRAHVAQRNQMVAKHWLPAAGLGDTAPGLLRVVAQQDGRRIWHVYEDLGDCVLVADNGAVRDRGRVFMPDPERIEPAVALIARIHARFARHPLLAECRLYGDDFGPHFFASAVDDAVRCLEALLALKPAAVWTDLLNRLLARMQVLGRERGDRIDALTRFGGPETLLHGDLWPINVMVSANGGAPHARLIDWDHVGVGSVSYDLSTFLSHFPREDRTWILDRYLRSMQAHGIGFSSETDWNGLFDTAEQSRLAFTLVWEALSALAQPADWAFEELALIEHWFEGVEPVLPAGAATGASGIRGGEAPSPRDSGAPPAHSGTMRPREDSGAPMARTVRRGVGKRDESAGAKPPGSIEVRS